MPVSFGKTNKGDLEATFEVLKNGPKSLALTSAATPCSGKVIGGNLSVIYSIYGTPSLPTLEGTVLLLEDLDEYHYHLDRMLLALKRKVLAFDPQNFNHPTCLCFTHPMVANGVVMFVESCDVC